MRAQTEKNHQKYPYKQQVFGPRCEPGASRIRRCVTRSTPTICHGWRCLWLQCSGGKRCDSFI